MKITFKENLSSKFCEKFQISKVNRQIIFIVLGTKIIILFFGLLSFFIFSDEKLTGLHNILGIWNNWDAKNYTSIAEYGYKSVGEGSFRIVFFPFYPFLIAVFNFFTKDSILSAFLISGIASIFLGFILLKTVKLDYSEETAISSVWFLFIFPTSYFLHIPYTESLFLALVIGCFYYCRRKRWLLAGILGFLACATRINGLILCFALLFEIFEDWKENKKFDKKWLWLGLMPLGFLVYLILNYVIAGDFFAFAEIQRNNFQKYLTFPWESILERLKELYHQTNTIDFMEGFFELFFTGIGFTAIVLGWRYLRNSYRIWMIANWLLFVSTAWLLSVPRYLLTMFPMFILITIFSKKTAAKILISTFSIILLGIFVTSFILKRWTF